MQGEIQAYKVVCKVLEFLSSHTHVQGQAVITETLLRAQEGGQDHTAVDDGPQAVPRQYHSTTDSEPFEVIEEGEEEVIITEGE